MNTLLTEPVVTAEAKAMAQALKPNGRVNRDRISSLLRAYLPTLSHAPAFLRRLLNEIWSGFMKQRPSLAEVEENRLLFFDLVELHLTNLRSAEAAARAAGFSASDVNELSQALRELEALQAELKVNWAPFDEETARLAEEDISAGRLHDIEELIRELQSRPR